MALVGLPWWRLGRPGSSFNDPTALTPPMSFAALFALLTSWAVCRLSVGRSGSSADAVPLEVLDAVSVVVVLPPEVVPSEFRRVMVGRSGSSAGVLPVCVVDVVVVAEVSVVVVPLLEVGSRDFGASWWAGRDRRRVLMHCCWWMKCLWS